MLVGGPALLNGKLPANAFAAGLSPILRRYFLSKSQENIQEILERAYVSSDEITEYDKILESLLRDRIAVRRGTVVQPLKPDRYGEDHVREAIEQFGRNRPESGQLQIVQGAVGSGKSLFIHRYRAIQSDGVADTSRWAFVDFNTSPADLAQGETWLARTFIESFEAHNPEIDITAPEVLRGMFSRNLQRRRIFYAALPAEQAEIERARDLTKWLDDPMEAVRGIAEYVLGSRREILVAVMDNVDRLDLQNQLSAFQLTLWFMQQTRAFVILQMRDETYERYKDRPPLDTFRSGITFHISPPRFIDVVKRRLELSLEYLQAHSRKTESYVSDAGLRIAVDRDELAEFLALLYSELFDRKRNLSRLLEAIAGWDVRRALDMFVSIIVSGHLDEPLVTRRLLGGEREDHRPFARPTFSEHLVLRILMRTEYRFFSEHSGFVSNVFDSGSEWEKPDNFLLVEILYYLALNKKRTGQIGLQGYFTCESVMHEVQRLGYVERDVLDGLNRLLKRRLIGADHMNFNEVGPQDSVRIHASGFIHVRVLTGRLEYLHGIIPTTPIFDGDTAQRLADYVRQESARGHSPAFQKANAVEVLVDYLSRQRTLNATPFNRDCGADYVLKNARAALQHFHNERGVDSLELDPLDL